MSSNICALEFKLFFVLIFSILGCNNATHPNDIKPVKVQQVTHKDEDSIITTLANNQYKLVVETKFSTDTVDAIDYKEDPYSSPIILEQKIFFYNGEKLIRLNEHPIKYVTKQTTSKKSLQTLQTPIYQICLTKTDGDSYYLVYGSDYCNGSNCPEFLGIYSMLGKTIYEGLSTEQQKPSLKEVLAKHSIDINNRVQCSQINLFK